MIDLACRVADGMNDCVCYLQEAKRPGWRNTESAVYKAADEGGETENLADVDRQ